MRTSVLRDPHDNQGSAGTAIETPMNVTIRLTVLKGADAPFSDASTAPHYETTNAVPAGERYYATTGIGPGASSGSAW